MAREYDYIRTEDEDGELKHKRTRDPDFRNLGADSVTAGGLSIDGHLAQFQLSDAVVPVSPSLGVDDAVGLPASTPINDAAAKIAAAGEEGTVVLPNRYVGHNGAPINLQGVAGLVNPTGSPGNTPECVVQVSDETLSEGWLFENDVSWRRFGGFRLRGPGEGIASGPAIRFSPPTAMFNNHFLPLLIGGWGAEAILHDSGKFFQNHFEHLVADDVDAGDKSAVFRFQKGGTMNTAEILGANPAPDRTGSNSTIISTGAPFNIHINHGFCGGSTGAIANFQDDDSGLIIDSFQYEPINQQSTPFYLISSGGPGLLRVHDMTFAGGGSTKHVYQLGGGGASQKYLAAPQVKSLTITDTVVNISQDTAAGHDRVHYQGLVSDVKNDSGALLSEPVICHGDITKKVSTGVGYDGGTNDAQL